MARRNNYNKLDAVMEMLIENGFDGFADALRILLNEAMKIERDHILRAGLYERTETRRGYANGYKPKTVDTRVGKLVLDVPQVRGDVDFYPSALERGSRSERALKLAVAEMYVKGISTRRVADVLEKMCGLAVFALPAKHRKRLRTTNMLERLHEEINRRSRVARLFPNEASLLRLVSAIEMEISEDWIAGKRYLDMNAETENESESADSNEKRIYRKNVA